MWFICYHYYPPTPSTFDTFLHNSVDGIILCTPPTPFTSRKFQERSDFVAVREDKKKEIYIFFTGHIIIIYSTFVTSLKHAHVIFKNCPRKKTKTNATKMQQQINVLSNNKSKQNPTKAVVISPPQKEKQTNTQKTPLEEQR